MLRLKRQSVLVTMACALCMIFVAHPSLEAQDHIVSPADLQKVAVAATHTRQKNVATLNHFFSTPRAKHALQSAHIDLMQVKTAVSSLSDEELAQMAARADKAQADFAAGNMGERDLLLILIGIVLLILIIVAVR